MEQETVKNSYIPKDYNDLYEAYFAKGKLASMLCKRMLFAKQAQDWEDAVQEAFLRLMRTGILEKFDATRANFGGMVFAACRSACCNMGRAGAKEVNHLSLQESTEERIPGAIAGETLLVDEGEENRAIARLTVKELIQKAKENRTRSVAKRYRSQEQLIELLLDGYSNVEIAGKLSVSRASVDLWVAALGEL